MCGIAGIISLSSKAIQPTLLKKMVDAIAHRGSDGEGFWYNENQTVLLGHRRLSIIDLSNVASQPMHYQNRYTITYNGEVYNYLELKDFLKQKGYQFKSQSDTEVILAAYDFWGDTCLSHFDGMFSFAIWDQQEKKLFAARDRFGEKPFYFYQDNDNLFFASEMKAFWAAGITKVINEKMLLNYLAIGHVQNPTDKKQTFFTDVYSLPPAHYINFKPSASKQIIPKTYWALNKNLEISISVDDAIEKFNHLFLSSIQKRLRSDVAVGTSLSGGLDSSSIVAALKNNFQKKSDLKTFSAVFPGFEKDESTFINLVTKQFNILNFKTEPTVDGLIKDFESLCFYQDEPFLSSSIYAQYQVFELAKQHQIKVLLDGQGADETLAGYHKYIHWFLQEGFKRNRFKATINQKNILVNNHIPFNWSLKNYIAAFFPVHTARLLQRKEYQKIINQPDIHPDFLKAQKGREWEGLHKPIVTKLNDILHFNTIKMGLEELLRYADRNSMAHGREVRLPFLDHQLVEFIFSLPANFKINNGFTKWILRQAMDKKLPNEIVWRKDKIGYEPPQKLWMQNKVLQDYLFESKKILVNKNILSNKVLDKMPKPQNALSDNNFDWRYLCAAQII